VVTGAAGGIGHAIVERLVAEQRLVVAVDVDEDALAALTNNTPGVVAAAGDICDRTFLESLPGRLPEGTELAGWVNNAGVYAMARVQNLQHDDVRRVLSVDLEAALHGCGVAVGHFLRRDAPGSVVNVTSLQAQRAFVGFAAYAAAKAGLEAATRCAAVEAGPRGIRVNAVAPGTVLIPKARGQAEDDPDFAEQLDHWAGRHPLRRLGQPSEIAAAVAFLLSEDSSFITGHVLAVDGGWSATSGDDGRYCP
jgi:NAD(P)-dependent dehydrogenase (short-subunit alcohol dehydrogenase family)